jgi:biopolymer transport protein ExbB
MKKTNQFFTSAMILLISLSHLSLASAQTAAPAAAPTVLPAADNPYGLAAVWGQGDWVAKTTILLLIIMSLASWYVLVSKLLEQNKLKKMTLEAEEAFVKANSFQQGLKVLDKESPYRFMVEASLEAVEQHSLVAGQVDLNTWAAQSIERSVATVQSNTQQGLAVLATVGSTAPFVGLFGTVWGIYNALVKIGATGQASIDKVAGPVGEALIMTAIGLAVAVPAVLGYNWLVRRNKMGMESVRAFGSNLHTNLLVQADKLRAK